MCGRTSSSTASMTSRIHSENTRPPGRGGKAHGRSSLVVRETRAEVACALHGVHVVALRTSLHGGYRTGILRGGKHPLAMGVAGGETVHRHRAPTVPVRAGISRKRCSGGNGGYCNDKSCHFASSSWVASEKFQTSAARQASMRAMSFSYDAALSARMTTGWPG